MPSSFPSPAHLPCSLCGASIAHGQEEAHVCDEERQLRYRLIQLRDEIAAFDTELTGYLDSPKGKFETWYAARERLRRRSA